MALCMRRAPLKLAAHDMRCSAQKGPGKRKGSAPRDASQLEAMLLSALQVEKASGHVIEQGSSRHERTSSAVVALEGLTGFGTRGTGRTRLLSGLWRLAATDSPAVAKNAGSISGLAALPGVRCSSVAVALRRDGAARTVEEVKVLGFVGRNILEGTWTVAGKGEDRLEVTYASATLVGGFKLRADSKAVLTTTYCSKDIRIGRSGKGDFYVFVKDDNVNVE